MPCLYNKNGYLIAIIIFQTLISLPKPATGVATSRKNRQKSRYEGVYPCK